MSTISTTGCSRIPNSVPFFDDADIEHLRRTQTDFLCEAAGGPEIYEGPGVREAHLDVPFEPQHVDRTIEMLSESLASFDVEGEDAEAVVGAVAAYEADLLAGPDDPDP